MEPVSVQVPNTGQVFRFSQRIVVDQTPVDLKVVYVRGWLVGLLKIVLSELIKAVGLGGTDMVLGGAIGLVRGLVIVLIAVLACGMTALPEEDFWQDAVSSKWFETAAVAIKPWLPDELAKHINFHSPMKA